MMLATAILAFSIVGLALLLSLKAWEMKRGVRLFPKVREGTDVHASRALLFIRSDLPRSTRRVFKLSRMVLRAYISFASARILFYFERVLERVLHKVRTTPQALKERGEASPFLREVAAYKRMLEREVEAKTETSAK